jgi:FAD/FMN-containing dehydrogenase
MDYASWGRYPRVRHQQIVTLPSRRASLQLEPDQRYLPRGNGRSYGDVCLNDGGHLLTTQRLDHFVEFDRENGILRCESGLLLGEILRVVAPHGWFLPAIPGTQLASVGGAIANDVHGKNHHVAGTFGCHVRGFELLRSDGTRRWCSPTSETDLFCATIGGLGLTGLITVAELQLMRVSAPAFEGESLRFRSLSEFFALSAESDRRYDYTVAWIDCLNRQGRGIFQRARHASRACVAKKSLALSVPVTPPLPLVNGLSLRAFNTLYYNLPRKTPWTVHYAPFLFPLDGIAHWNRLYGPQGFVQYQCVVPAATAATNIADLLAAIAASGQGSFLAVLKMFGDRPSPGMLSFPRAGATLALDFPMRSSATLKLLERLDRIVDEAGGALYPAKDARMTASGFRRYFPRWEPFREHIDPQFSSGFWRRVTAA